MVPPTSVTWVHPSWRDLVIDELATNPGERRRFLSNCTIEGFLLAISIGGGASGERNFPLLLADEDWDAATDRLHELIGDLDEPSLHRLFSALEAALEGARENHTRSEVRALAMSVLGVLARRWDDAHTAIPAALLGSWFAAASKLPELEAVPDLTSTWIEFLPPSRIDIESDQELRRFDEWLRLAEILEERSPETLERFQFPERQAEVFSLFLEDTETLIERGVKPRIEPVLSRCLTRLVVVAPNHSYRALELAATLNRMSHPFLSEDIPSAPEPEPEVEADNYVVARILSDLELWAAD